MTSTLKLSVSEDGAVSIDMANGTFYCKEDLVNVWLPISTAPKDGTKVDLWGINNLHYDKKPCRKTDMSWGERKDVWGRPRFGWGFYGEGFEPTHWMKVKPPQDD